MPRGGRRDCCNKYGVFGFSADAPDLIPMIEHAPASDPSQIEYFPGGKDNTPGGQAFADSASWTIRAAKVPTSFPYSACDTNPPMSSDDPRSEEQWGTDIGSLANVTFKTGWETDYGKRTVNNVQFVMCSRVIRIDGEQRYVTYGLSSHRPFPATEDGEPSSTNWLSIDSDTKHYNHVQIDIANPSTVVTYPVEWLGKDADFWFDALSPPDGANVMQLYFTYLNDFFVPDCGVAWYFRSDSHGTQVNWQHACNCAYYGKEFYFASTYSPGLGGTTGWAVARVEYANIPEVYCSDFAVGFVDSGEPTCTGPYHVMLPSCRAFLLSTADLPDEPWVIAKTVVGDPKLVTGKIHNNVTRTNVDGDVWDGTLTEDEVANTIVPPISGPYTGETWSNLAVRSYNHIDGKDYVIFTTHEDGDDSSSTTAAPLADFENGSHGADFPNYLNNGVDSYGMSFDSGGINTGDGWIQDTGDKHSGANGLRTNEADVTKENQISLSIKVNVVSSSALTFWYRLDNRKYGERVAPFTELTDFPEPDNHLIVFVDGTPTPIDIILDGTSGGSSTHFGEAIIDNVAVPADFSGTDDAPYLLWRKASITLPPGDHVIRWTLFRKWQDNGHLVAWLDDIQFPTLLTGDDYNAVKRWYYDGERVRRAKFWAFPLRDNEAGTDISGRVSTVPDFISKDDQGRILYGNPHYVCRIIVDGIDNEANPDGVLDKTFADNGIFRLTASPAVQPPQHYQDGNCEWIDALPSAYDQVADPPWGTFQILPTGNSIQLRGANGSLDRDATIDPTHQDNYPNEQFVNLTRAGVSSDWNHRVSCWTLEDDGHTVVPHVEMLWRPTYDQPAFPVAPTYSNPPWPLNMEDDSSDLLANESTNSDNGNSVLATRTFCRIRDPSRFDEKPTHDPDTRKPVWNGLNRVVPRMYTDVYCRQQVIWVRPDLGLYPDPADDSDPLYFFPPFPSVDWKLIGARHCPSIPRCATIDNHAGPNLDACLNCSSTMGDPNFTPDCEENNYHYTWGWPGFGGSFFSGFTDFDAVDCDCDCGCG